MPNTQAGLLALDVGNTNIHLGWWNGHEWQYNWRARTVHDKMADEYAVLLRTFLEHSDLSFADVSDVVIASVVPPVTSTLVELCQRYMHIQPLVISTKINTGVRVDIDNPEQVGADRIVNAAAVHELYGGPAIVIDLGTATTFDVISAKGDYVGGSIAPGIGIMLDALVGNTAQLYKVSLDAPPSPIGRNTATAIQSGIFLGYLGLVEGLVQRLLAAMPRGEKVKIIATGGLAPVLRNHTTIIEEIAPFLTLDGMRLLHHLNRPPSPIRKPTKGKDKGK